MSKILSRDFTPDVSIHQVVFESLEARSQLLIHNTQLIQTLNLLIWESAQEVSGQQPIIVRLLIWRRHYASSVRLCLVDIRRIREKYVTFRCNMLSCTPQVYYGCGTRESSEHSWTDRAAQPVAHAARSWPAVLLDN